MSGLSSIRCHHCSKKITIPSFSANDEITCPHCFQAACVTGSSSPQSSMRDSGNSALVVRVQAPAEVHPVEHFVKVTCEYCRSNIELSARDYETKAGRTVPCPVCKSPWTIPRLCPRCSEPCPSSSQFCPNCGSPIAASSMPAFAAAPVVAPAHFACPRCRSVVRMGSFFCPLCGMCFQSTPAPIMVSAPPYAAAPYSSKSKVTAGLLGILLGGLGAHKFYLNEIAMGILYLLFCWTYIPAIVGLIEGIVYLSMDEASFAAKYGQRQ